MFERLKSLVGLKQKSGGEGTWTVVAGASATVDGEEASAKALYFNWVAKCVTVRANNIASAPIDLVELDADGNELIITDHPVVILLRDVNPYHTRYTIMQRLEGNLCLYGNEYWLLIRDKRTNQPIEIIPLKPWLMEPVSDPNVYVKGYNYTVNGQTKFIPKEDIIHFKTYNPFSDICGLSIVETSSTILYGDKYTATWKKNFYKNSALPDTIITTEARLQPGDVDRIREQWKEEFGGVNRAGNTAVMHSGMKVEAMQRTMADLQFIEEQNKSKDDIFAMFGVPKTAAVNVDGLTYASARVTDFMFYKHTIYPELSLIFGALTEFLLPEWPDTKGMYFRPREPMLVDQESTTRNQMMYVNNVLSINEWRSREGLAPIDDGDKRYFEMQPVAPSFVSQPAQQNSFRLTNRIKPRVNSLHEGIAKCLPHLTKIIDVHPKKKDVILPKQNRMSLERFEEVGTMMKAQQDNREDKYIPKFKAAAMKLFEDQTKRAIKQLKKQSKAINPKDLLDRSREIKATIDILTPILAKILKEQGEEALARIDAPTDGWSISLPTVRDYLKNNTKKLAGSMTDTTIEAIRSAIADGLDAEEGIDELSTRIQDLVRLSEPRADMIALSETHRASALAELEAFKQSEVVTSKIWYTAQDERTCPECDVMNGTEVPLDEPFLSVKDVEDMGFQNYDGAIDTPMLHPQCRCTLVPVIKE